MKNAVLASLLFAACSHASSPAPATSPAAPAADPLAAQIEQGKGLYVAKCAKCHGDGGQGTKDGPAVVGEGVFPQKPREGSKRDVEFKTAADVFAWASKTMPGDDPGTLSADEMLAVFAFDLTANGVKLTAPLDGTQAAAIVLHP
jgi:mono/diheme cytochrome c family protein